MFRGIFRWSPSMAAAIFLAVATGAQGQEEGIASGYAPADQASVVQAGSNPQTIAFGQPGAGDAEQTAFLAPPAPDDPANADLVKRVADLERRLAILKHWEESLKREIKDYEFVLTRQDENTETPCGGN